MKKKNKKILMKLTIADYVKAIKIADREIQKTQNPGWTSTDRIHPSKKTYNRRANKRIEE
jgi:hypothetical protein